MTVTAASNHLEKVDVWDKGISGGSRSNRKKLKRVIQYLERNII